MHETRLADLLHCALPILQARMAGAHDALGAQGVQIDTAYLCCPESTISAVYRDALASDGAQHTRLPCLFSGRSARGIVKRLMRELDEDFAPTFPTATAAIAPLRNKAEAQGRGDFSPLWAGQNVGNAPALPAAELTRLLP